MTEKLKFSDIGTQASGYCADGCGKAGVGIVGLVLDLGWGSSGEAVTVTDTGALCDVYLYKRDAVIAIGDILKNAGSVIYCRPRGGEYASCVFGRARYTGTAGNRIVIACREGVNGGVEVITYVDGITVDVQAVAGGTPTDNDYVIFDAGCELFITAGVPMSGGEDAVMTDEEYTTSISVLSGLDIDMLLCVENEEARISAFVDAVCKNRSNGGTLCGITSADLDYANANVAYAVTSVYCGGDETSSAVYYLSGLLASLPFYSSAVGKKYGGSLPLVAYDEAEAADVPKNRLILAEHCGDIYIYRDGDDTEQRICDEVKRRIVGIFTERFRGKIKTNGAGIALLRDEIAQILYELDDSYGVIDRKTSDISAAVNGNGVVAVTVNVKCKPRVRGINIGVTMR